MVIYGCSACNLCFLIHTNTCAVKSSENVTSFGIKRDCNWLDLDKVSLKLASKNLVGSKLKPRFKIFSVLFKKKGFPYGLLQAENIRSLRSARCSRVVLSKLLAASKMSKFFNLYSCSQKNRSAWHARECSKRPFVTPKTY